MSQNPYGYPYGSGQAPPQSYPYPPFNAYPPPNGFAGQPPPLQHPFQSPSYPNAPEGYYATSQSAYDHNAGSIPGLGRPSTSQVPMAFNASWTQAGYPAVGTPVHYAPPTHVPFSTQVAYSTPQFEAPPPSIAQTTAQTSPLARTAEEAKHEPKCPLQEHTKPQHQPQADNTESQDEGEISDGYFDDLYDDVSNQQLLKSQQATASPAKFADNGDADALDQETNFYDTDMEETSAAVATTSSSQPRILDRSKLAQEVERERTRSYSPHLSPAEVEQADEVAATITGPHNTQAVAQPTAGSSNDAKASIQSGYASTASQSFASLPEAHNEAKKAILRLLPHGVKFQTYIDEGFDADLIRSLFMQLNLPTDPLPTTSQKPVAVPEKTVQEPSVQKPQSALADSMAKKQEERKDRIARLLAEKKAKAAVAPPTASRPTSNDAPQPPTASPAVATKGATTRAENDRLLQQKIALIKARNTQKIGQSSQTRPSSPSATAKPATPQGFPESTQSPMRSVSVSDSTMPSQIPPPPSQHLASKPTTPLRPSSVTASPTMANAPTGPRGLSQFNQRKRPVAADFMDGPAPSIKRPFLANRQNSSLVISISDDEDDDEDDDVEMEVDSATDESSAPAQQSIVLPRRGPAIRDYPPLTNTNTPRQIPSPLSALAGKSANGDLEAKEKAIEALRRRIEEAEARAKIKPKKGSVTPQTPRTSQTPDAGNASPAEQVTKPALEPVAPSHEMDDDNGSTVQQLPRAAATVEPAASGPAPVAVIPAVQRKPDFRRPAQHSAATPPVKSAKMLAKEERLRRVREELERLEAEISNDLADEEDDDDDEEQAPSQAPPPTETLSPSSVGANVTNVEHVPKVDAPQADSTFPEHHQPIDKEAATMADQFLASMEHSPFGSASASNDPPPYEGLVDTQGTSQGQVPISDVRLSQEESADSDTSMSDDYEPPEAQVENHMEAASSQSTPAASDSAKKNAASSLVQGQHIDTSQANHSDEIKANTHEVQTQELAKPAGTLREVHGNLPSRADGYLTSFKAADRSSPIQKTSFPPYESPLRYFHSYRFHPGFSNEVSGGLKSLTYSNRIDPNKEMCPDEWEGNDCPRGNACQFQHFHSIIAPDNEIILELGNSDEFSGEQKKEFNKGLREMVAQFQKSKIRDFRTIAQAIVDFRRQFVSDPSKILRLEGVTL